MFECQICGLLSLGGASCPACGSQLRTDLSKSMASDEVLPADVPGLDDAAAAWYDLEGLEAPEEPDADTIESSDSQALPFGFQGESKVFQSRLPFGIGSFAEGIPFDAQIDSPTQAKSSIVVPEKNKSTAELKPAASTTPVSNSSIVEAMKPDNSTPVPVQETTTQTTQYVAPFPPSPAAPSPAAPSPGPTPSNGVAATTPIQQAAQAVVLSPASPEAVIPTHPPATVEQAPVQAPVRISSARLVEPAHLPRSNLVPVLVETPEPAPLQQSSASEVPSYWQIDAQIPNYEEIYGQPENVVEMNYGTLTEDVVMFSHETDSPAAVFHSPLESSPVSSTSHKIELVLHPVQVMNVDVGGSSELNSLLTSGFRSMQSGAWSDAARSFQRMAASLPSSSEVFNNYGISLLQRAIAMRDSLDLEQQQLAPSQFDSAILALREAAKNAPTNGDILVNLACALIESGRSEKALGILNVHNQRDPDSHKGQNTAAVAMFNLGQSSRAEQTLSRIQHDPIAFQNLQLMTNS